MAFDDRPWPDREEDQLKRLLFDVFGRRLEPGETDQMMAAIRKGNRDGFRCG